MRQENVVIVTASHNTDEEIHDIPVLLFTCMNNLLTVNVIGYSLLKGNNLYHNTIYTYMYIIYYIYYIYIYIYICIYICIYIYMYIYIYIYYINKMK